MKEMLPLKLVLDLQPFNAAEVFGISRNYDEVFFKGCCGDARIRVDKINTASQHIHQVSTLRTISAPCRKSAASSDGEASPPHSPLTFAKKASSLALSSSSHVIGLLRYSSQRFIISSI